MAKNFDVENIFTYHKPHGDQPERYVALRAKAKELAQLIDESCPDSREKSVAFTNLQQAVMWANASIAVNEKAPEQPANTEAQQPDKAAA